MKAVSWALMISLPLLIIACGKENRTGRSGGGTASAWDFTNPLVNGIGAINSPYSFGGVSLNQVQAENPCINGFGGFPMPNATPYNNQRIPIQIPLTNFPTVIAPNDVYVGVTSYGDVGALVGTAPGQPPMFVGYMCPRSFSPTGQGQLLGVNPGTFTQCLFKPVVAATIVFPGGGSADFRMLDYGSSARQKFSFCR